MSELVGTAALVRFALRRDRVRVAVWIASLGLLVVSTAASVQGLFPTQADLDAAAAASEHNPAAIAFNGPVQALDTMGGQISFQAGTITIVLIGLMSLLMVGRLTRGEEEDGRLELLRSTVVGRHAPTVAALVVVGAMDLAVGVAASVGLLGLGLPAAGSFVFGASVVVAGWVFASVALVAAQLTGSTRAAGGIAGGVLGAAFVLRAIGDVGDGRVSWLSPVGWSQKARPFAGERWWPLLVPVLCAVALVVVAAALANHRDVGAGLIAPRPGPARAAQRLGRPVGLAARLQRGSVVGWTVGLFLLGVAYGSVANDIEDFVGTSDEMRDLMAPAAGVRVVDSFLSQALLVTALVASGFTVLAVLRLRSEETGQRAELLLAGPVSRMSWAGSHLVVAFVGSALVLSAGALGTALPYALATGDAGQVPRLVAAALAYLPAVWVLGAVAVALVGLAPRATVAVWSVLAVSFVVGFLGILLRLPGWVMDVSPYEHVPALPAANFRVMPLALLTIVAASLTGIGLEAFARRDIG